MKEEICNFINSSKGEPGTIITRKQITKYLRDKYKDINREMSIHIYTDDCLKQMCDSGILKRVARGVYCYL